MVTYEFYKNTYFGDAIDEPSFHKWESRAEDKLQAVCFGRIDEDALAKYGVKIQKALCAVSDVLFQIDFATKNAHDPKNGNVKSMSSGGQSVAFGENDTLVSKVLSDKTAQERLVRDAAADYLADTGLMYCGG